MARILLWHESRLTNWASIFNQRRTGLYNNHQVFKLLLPKLLIEVFVGGLLKGEVLCSRNAKRTNNLIMESETVPCKAVALGEMVELQRADHFYANTSGIPALRAGYGSCF
ncbi:hypothetical protein YC2023_076544 [Brassica napus]